MGAAYEDRPLPIGEHETISQPYIVAAMTEAVQVALGDKALEIGAGSGYQAGKVVTTRLGACQFVPLIGKGGWAESRNAAATKR